MAKRPWFKLFIADWLIATSSMTLEEQGAYMRLLAIQWAEGAISREPKRVALKLGVTLEHYERELSGMVATHFPDGVNPRLERERQEADGLSQANSINGKKRAESGRDGNGRYIQSSDRSSDSPPTPPPPHQPVRSQSQKSDPEFSLSRTRVIGPEQLWVNAIGLQPGSGVLDAWILAKNAAPAKGKAPEEFFSEALGAFSRWVDSVPANRRPQKSPQKFVEHFARIQEILDGKRPIATEASPANSNAPLPPCPAELVSKTEPLP